jgi:hypothetical protein
MEAPVKWLLMGFLAVVYACGGTLAYEAPVPDSRRPYERLGVMDDGVYSDQEAYRRIGLVVSGPSILFVGSPAFFPTLSSDTMLVVELTRFRG